MTFVVVVVVGVIWVVVLCVIVVIWVAMLCVFVALAATNARAEKRSAASIRDVHEFREVHRDKPGGDDPGF